MRKIISLGLFALMLSVFSSQVFAGKVGFCEDEKDELKSKGLYGLCNAYWSADNENARTQILMNFVKKAGTSMDDPGMPGWESEQKSVQDFYCPCWDGIEFADVCELGAPFSSRFDDDSGEVTFVDFTVLLAEGFGSDEASCGHVIQHLVDGYLLEDYNDEKPFVGDEAFDCRAELEIIASMHLSTFCE